MAISITGLIASHPQDVIIKKEAPNFQLTQDRNEKKNEHSVEVRKKDRCQPG